MSKLKVTDLHKYFKKLEVLKGIDLEIQEGEVVCSAKQKVTVIGTELPKLDIMHTEWMHADCLADYYHVEVFSEEHWKLLENYFQEYVKRDCNMMLTPLFTSPLDTAIGLERTTCQLIDVEVKDGRVRIWICEAEALDRSL